MTRADLSADQPVADTYEFSLTRDAWICFHCGERFSVAAQGCYAKALAAARAHFGAHPEDEPLCKLAMLPQADAAKRLREAELMMAQAITDRDTAEDEAASAQGELRSIADRFPGARTVYDAWCLFHSMEGRALAAEAIVAHIAIANQVVVDRARRIVCGDEEPQ